MTNRILRYVPAGVLGLFALINIGRGSIHMFAPDGGAGSIAGLDLTNSEQTILALFSSLGAGQLIWGLFQSWVLLLRRDLLLLALSLQAANTLVGVFNLHFYRTFPVEVPGKMFNTVLLAVILAALALAIYERRRTTDGK